ncbi:SusC/RagA family TonB-linked outer membrane protein [Flammeovirga yaeyamensis]|uniref:SusC/RagA family TonB-linked outer membrane protein n=1 Tax=Flammeovirga yaeyamensis TaxID=367791 RepID=A0AAX1N3Y3_9BACT|nr:SusC/RagA family TonB-linked outer membrane protein [Flammeovirga yaeyamensis]MBB3699702.1 TonB-linked SusC/RagA family outer membrane protein [Flammeovirga yaeyamensis]NMF36728.1 SusC/RagA family TonB-linked outer membrane protein [Flammeovirga yaeyamensis]QWG02230.1 SusC/RagA family TonB-linked outer membrane protein [Flammeovirga yaeyamensis]
MKFRLLTLLSSLLLLANVTLAQDKIIEGVVTESGSSDGLPGVNVLLKGTSTGTTTDFNGKFSLSVQEGATLVFSYVGYVTQEVPVGNQSNFNISLEVDAEQLEEVVVTAFGMERETKALGYSVQEVKGDDLAIAKEPNVINNLSGKVAGVQITKTAAGAGGSSRVVIRGNSSLTGSNQPLYIIDGVPIDNSSFYSAQGSYWDGGIDYGDGIGDINADDIETLSVLKGPAAAALYGSRAGGGVIVITTKTGKAKEGISVEYNGNFTFENPLVMPSFQNEYGIGTFGNIPNPDEIRNPEVSGSSWGPRMNGQSYVDWTGNQSTYTAQPDNVNDFFQTGSTMTNSIAVSGGSENADFRMSYANLQNSGIIPTSSYERNNLGLRGRLRSKKFTFDTKVNYVNVKGNNRPYMAETMENPMFTFIQMPRSIRNSDLQNNYLRDGEHYNYTESPFVFNPYFSINKSPNWDEKNRVIALGSVKYDLTENLSFQLRHTADIWQHERYKTAPKGQNVYHPPGRLSKDLYNVQEQNTDFLVNFKKDFDNELSFNVLAGGNLLKQRVVHNQTIANALLEKDWYSFNNADGGTSTTEHLTEKEVQSLYAQMSVAYKNMLFVDVTARNDWSSALPTHKSGYFYPSITGAFAFSEMMNVDESIFTFGKVRASYAQVGSDPNPYSQTLNYSVITQDVINGQPAGSIGSINNRGDDNFVGLVDPNIEPEKTTSIELGADLKFLNNRLGVDITYYNAVTSNQVIPVSLPYTAGAHSVVINQGSMRNKGIEVLVTADVFKKPSGFNWNMGVNFTKNNNTLEELYEEEGLTQILLNRSARGEANIFAEVGKPYGEIKGAKLVRGANGLPQLDEDGNIMLDADETGNGMLSLGNITPDYMIGFTNTFTYKNIMLNIVVDAKVGGDMFSYSNFSMHQNGNHQLTAEQRNAGGVKVVDANGQEQLMDTQEYYRQVGQNNVADDFVTDASYVKLRELSLGYNLPTRWTEKVFVKQASLSFVGRNLMFFYNGMDGIDPESIVSRGMLGIEYAALPSTASYGFNLNLKF